MRSLLSPRRAALFGAASLLVSAARAEIVLPAVISNGMVLPRHRVVPLWGKATPNMPVTALTSWDGQATTVLADAQGNWRIEVPTLRAGGPYQISLTEPGHSVLLEDVMFGEVWLCSGQSNMEWHFEWIHDAYRASAAYAPERDQKASAAIRLFHVPRAMSATRGTRGEGAWKPCTGAALNEFSAVGYFFARSLVEELGVPVGLIGSYWGGTPVESWLSPEVAQGFPRHADAMRALAEANSDVGRQRHAARVDAWWKETIAAVEGGESPTTPDFDDSGWTAVQVPGNWERGPLGEMDGLVWHRRIVDVPAALGGRAMVLNLGPVDDDEVTYWNGERIGATAGWTVPRSYRLTAEQVKPGRNVVAVLVHDSGGGGGFHGDAASMTLVPERDGPAVSLAGEWRATRVGAPRNGLPAAPDASPSNPSVLYNAMIAPLEPYALSGVIWYQGESNRYDPALYRETFPALIQDWRTRFARPELPFLWAQIAPFGYGGGAYGAHATALLREAQDLTMALPATAQVVLTDIGDVRDIHPKDKWTVGARLARAALVKAYGHDLDPYGPRYASHEVEGGALRVRFTSAEGGLVAKGDTLTWFHVAGADKKFVMATARIDGDSVLVSSPEVTAPVAVRFGWSDVAEPNLFDTDGLPAAPFRTDDWDDVTIRG
jgi:sialate O-acetylesterase